MYVFSCSIPRNAVKNRDVTSIVTPIGYFCVSSDVCVVDVGVACGLESVARTTPTVTVMTDASSIFDGFSSYMMSKHADTHNLHG